MKTLTAKKRWYPYGFEVVLSDTVEIANPELVPIFAQHLLYFVLLPELTSRDSLLDLKGGDWRTPPEFTSSFQEDELFFVSGTVQLSDNEINVPFTFRIHTTFKEFSGVHHIIYSPKLLLSENLERLISPRKFLKYFDLLPNIRIAELRLAMNFFSSKRAFIFGFSPVVTEAVHLEASSNKLSYELWGEGLAAKSFVELEKRGITGAVEKLVALDLAS